MYSAVLTTILASIACGPAVPEYVLVTARSGRQLKIEEVSEIARASGEAAMLLAYRSDLDLTDLSALHQEVDDVWQTFREKVEQRGLPVAVIRASRWEKPGWQRRGQAVQFIVERGPDGAWAARPDDDSAVSTPGVL